ncbi:MAG: hypothetical protein ACI9ZH_000033 [Paracoccaceae bacterium]|jgi:hypothetical protein
MRRGVRCRRIPRHRCIGGLAQGGDPGLDPARMADDPAPAQNRKSRPCAASALARIRAAVWPTGNTGGAANAAPPNSGAATAQAEAITSAPGYDNWAPMPLTCR